MKLLGFTTRETIRIQLPAPSCWLLLCDRSPRSLEGTFEKRSYATSFILTKPVKTSRLGSGNLPMGVGT